MSSFSADPSTLRVTASRVDAFLQGIPTGDRTVTKPQDVGHNGLRGAVDSFVDTVEASWRREVSETRSTADRLRDSAAMYEEADDNASGSIKTIEGFL